MPGLYGNLISPTGRRDLQSTDISWINKDVLDLSILPSGSSDISMLSFDWEAESFDQATNSLKLQLYFDNSQHISANLEQDKLMLQIKQPRLFGNENGLQITQIYPV